MVEKVGRVDYLDELRGRIWKNVLGNISIANTVFV